MRMDFDTEIINYPKDSNGFCYNYDLFTLAKVLRPGYADEFYRTRMGYGEND